MEYHAQADAAKSLKEKKSCLQQYDLSEADPSIGMICGGCVSICFYYLSSAKDFFKEFCRLGLDQYKAHEPMWLILGVSAIGLYSKKNGIFPSSLNFLSEYLPEFLTEKSSGPIYKRCTINGTDLMIEKLSDGSLVHIFGGGHVAKELVPILTRIGFSCVVYDDREVCLEKKRFPDADDTVLVDFNDLRDCLIPAAIHYFVIMTRGHQYDLPTQAFAMNSQSAYIGVMGSKKKSASISKKLREQGFSREALERIYTPIGLDIGSETPAEIAVSIAAELILVRRTGTGPTEKKHYDVNGGS